LEELAAQARRQTDYPVSSSQDKAFTLSQDGTKFAYLWKGILITTPVKTGPLGTVSTIAAKINPPLEGSVLAIAFTANGDIAMVLNNGYLDIRNTAGTRSLTVTRNANNNSNLSNNRSLATAEQKGPIDLQVRHPDNIYRSGSVFALASTKESAVSIVNIDSSSIIPDVFGMNFSGAAPSALSFAFSQSGQMAIANGTSNVTLV
jgi:hypothetical protein